MQISLSDLIEALPYAWNNETRGNEKYHGDHPAAGQCTVSSLLIQRHHGGEIVRCEVGGDSSYGRIIHYFNQIKGAWIDSTAGQFSKRSPRRKFQVEPKESLYIFRDTWQRVDLLEYRVRDILDNL